MEKHVGRYLTREEVVHHEDDDGLNNDIGNLRLFPSQAAHKRYHEQHRSRNLAGRYLKKGVA